MASIRKSADRVLCLLPFETEFYEAHGVAAGRRPSSADEVPMDNPAEEARAALGLDAENPVLALLPGSRRTEVARLAGPFLETAAWMRARRPGLQVTAGLANESTADLFRQKVRASRPDPPPDVHVCRARQVMAAADVVLTASEPPSLETMLTKRPMVVAYIVSAVTHRLVRLLGFRRWNILPCRICWRAGASYRNSCSRTCAPTCSVRHLESYLDAAHGQARIAAGMKFFGRSTSVAPQRQRTGGECRCGTAEIEVVLIHGAVDVRWNGCGGRCGRSRPRVSRGTGGGGRGRPSPRSSDYGSQGPKLLSHARRRRLAKTIRRRARAFAVALAAPREIDDVNILQASLRAMERAVRGLPIHPDLVQVDGNRAPRFNGGGPAVQAVVGGDRLVPAISAASILAKVYRDRLMGPWHLRYPGYGFDTKHGVPHPRRIWPR